MNELYFGDNLDILREHISEETTLRAGTEHPRYPDRTLGQGTFKQAALEDMSGEQGRLL